MRHLVKREGGVEREIERNELSLLLAPCMLLVRIANVAI